jgi:2-keto-4-pentenoate hydratase/2-oxohepta-3-ene-1,7-dioic acid hydratase in catechol pathway
MKKVNYLNGGKIQAGVLEGHQVVGQACSQPQAIPLSLVQLLPPVLEPGKIICVGMNYPPPVGDQDWTPPAYPVLFHKVSSSLIGFGAAIRLPAISQHVLYEGELAIVIGSEAKNIPVERALEVVAGYSIANDVGAADIEGRSSQWASGKMFDTFCPLGPALVTADEIPEPDNVEIKTTLNERVVQQSSTREMIFSVPYLISYISQLTTLQPNDLILTGSPKRAADQPDPRIPLKAGDTIQIEIEGLGVLINHVVNEEFNSA